MTVRHADHARLGYHRLLVWGLSGFHTTLFVVVGLLLLHSGGALGGALAQLDTLTGFVLFIGLWATDWGATRHAMRGISAAALGRPFAGGGLIIRGIVAGSVNGALFFLWLVLTLSAQAVVHGDGETALNLLVIATFGWFFAAVVGGVFGLLFAVIDTLLLEVPRWIVPAGVTAYDEPPADSGAPRPPA